MGLCYAFRANGPAFIRGAEGVGLLPTIGKTLKINRRFPRYVVQDYRTSVPLGKGDFCIRPVAISHPITVSSKLPENNVFASDA